MLTLQNLANLSDNFQALQAHKSKQEILVALGDQGNEAPPSTPRRM